MDASSRRPIGPLYGARASIAALAAAALALAGSLAPVARVARPAALGAAADLPSLDLPSSRLAIQNLEDDRPLDGVVVLRGPNGAEAARIALEAVPPLGSRWIELDAVADLPVGIYSAAITGTGRLAVAARYAWTMPDDEPREDVALAGASAPGVDVIVPHLALSEIASAVLSVQNAATTPASVDVALYPFEADGAAPVWEGRVVLPADGSAALDLAGPAFASLGGAFQGYARLRADGPVAVMALSVARGWWGTAAAAQEGQPVEAAGGRVVGAYQILENDQPSSALAVVNPGAGPARVRLTYHTEGGPAACGRGPFVAPEVALAAGGAVLVQSAPDMLPGMGSPCFGLVTVDAAEGGVLSAMLLTTPIIGAPEPQVVAALPMDGPPALRWAAPHLQWFAPSDPAAPRGWFRGVSVTNPNEAPADAALRALDGEGRPVAVPWGERAAVAALGAHSFYVVPSLTRDLAVGFRGAGRLEADAAVEAWASEGSGRPEHIAVMAAVDVDAAITSAYVPFLARPPRWPSTPDLRTPPAAPTAVPTALTMVPPRPRADPTLPAPPRLARIAWPEHEDWVGCCVGLAWGRGDVLWGAELGDGVGIGIRRVDLSGREVAGEVAALYPERVKVAPDGSMLVLDTDWPPTLKRFGDAGDPLGRVALPSDLDRDVQDVAAAPDGTLWLVDNHRLEVHHLAASGDHLGEWSVAAALRYPPGDGAYRVAVAPDGASVYVLTWARVLRYATDGRLLAAWGAPRLALGPDDFQAPTDLAVDGQGRVYVLEATGRVQVFEPDGWRVASWTAFDCPVGADDERPAALALGPEGQVAVADAASGRVHVFAPLGSEPAPPVRGPFRAHLPYGARPEGGRCGPAGGAATSTGTRWRGWGLGRQRDQGAAEPGADSSQS